jgi:TPR repeat protein
MNVRTDLRWILASLALVTSAPALADVKAGVDAWARGDYVAAVREWRGPATAGDADAQFNMAQAYRLGRGVEENAKQAEILYAKAAAQGHIKASDNYGLLLFQAGRREEAMPYIKGAADRGDPRAQYLLGIAHFNGELVEKDWVRAYALLTLANGAGLEQAPAALAQMDDFIPLEQRQQAQLLAQGLRRDADTRRAQQMAAVDLAIGEPVAQQSSPAPTTQAIPPRALPEPIPSAAVPPSVAAARAAIEEAMRVTGTEDPGSAGADFTQSPAPAPVRTAQADVTDPPRARPGPVPRPPAPQVTAQPAAQAAVQQAAQTSGEGPWRVQLGAFSVRANADKLWTRVAGNPALAGKSKFVVPAGNVVRLQAGGFASQGAAQSACNSLKSSGQACLVTR